MIKSLILSLPWLRAWLLRLARYELLRLDLAEAQEKRDHQARLTEIDYQHRKHSAESIWRETKHEVWEHSQNMGSIYANRKRWNDWVKVLDSNQEQKLTQEKTG